VGVVFVYRTLKFKQQGGMENANANFAAL